VTPGPDPVDERGVARPCCRLQSHEVRSPVLPIAPLTARTPLVHWLWVRPSINPAPRTAPSSIASCARTWRPSFARRLTAPTAGCPASSGARPVGVRQPGAARLQPAGEAHGQRDDRVVQRQRATRVPLGAFFSTLIDAQTTLDRYRDEYNNHRPHSSLGDQTPAQFRAGTTNHAGREQLSERVA
jgi:putative transposase